MAHSHKIIDTDTHFSINAVTRAIKNESSRKTTLIQYDHNSERFTFTLPRYIEGHDMSLCNNVRVHYINVDSENKRQVKGVYEVEDLHIDPDDENKVICSWLISSNATQYSGGLSFLIRYACLEKDTITYAWNTAVFTEIYVGKGLDSAVGFESQYFDIIQQWKDEVMKTFNDHLAQWKEDAKSAVLADVSAWKKEATQSIEDWENEQSEEVHRVMGDYEEYTDRRMAVLEGRMDTFTSLEEGSTTGDAELMDARVGADGTVYDSAGTAIRSQFFNVDSVLNNLETDFTNLLPILKENTKVLTVNGGTLETPELLDVRVVSNTNYGAYYVNRFVHSNCTKLMILQKVKIVSGDFSNYPHVYCYDESNKMIDGATRLYRGSLEINGVEYYVNCISLVEGTKSIGIGSYSMKTGGICEVATNPVLFDVSKFSDATIEKFYTLLLTDFIEKYYEEWHGNAPYYTFYADKAKNAEKANEATLAEHSNRSQSCYLAETPAREIVTEITDWNSTVTPTETGFNIVLKESWGGIGLVRNFIVGKKYLVIWQGAFADKVGFIKNTGSSWNGISTKFIQVDGINYYYGYAEALEDDLLNRIIIHTKMEEESTISDVTITEIVPELDITTELVTAIIKGVVIYIPELKEKVSNLEAQAHTHMWSSKNVLVIGDSLTASGIWQKQLNSILGMNVTTHAKGGMGIIQCVDGENGAGEYDNETATSGVLYALNAEDVADKDLIVFFAGYNNRGMTDGVVGDCYNPTDNSGKTIAGITQYAINRIYEELSEAENLTCRVAVITPHCAGKYGYIDADGYDEYPKGSGQSMRTLAKIIEDVALYNSLPCLNLWENSGINRHTWSVFSANSTATNEDGSGNGTYPYNNDQLHLNNEVGYPYLGKRIANWVQTI